MENNRPDKDMFDENEKNTENKNDDKNKKNKKFLIFFIIILILLCIVICVIQAYNRSSEPSGQTQSTQTSAVQSDVIKNPVNFTALQKKNDEIYAWIKVDGTKVDYPIVQSASDDAFYLKHKAEDKSWSASGAVYTESANSRQFTDPVTVVYGHNGYGDTFFTTLHSFESKEFFDSHPNFYIYMPGKRLTYQIVSAFKYDDRHILNSFDFTNSQELEEFQNIVKDPSSAVKNVRTQLDTQINRYSRIVVLSTCITNQKSSRYLVCGVLVKDEKTD